MNSKSIFLFSALLLLLVITAGCSPGQVADQPTREVEVETEEPALPPTDEPTATVEIEAAVEENIETEEPGQSEDDNGDEVASSEQESACLDCHTDQAMLIDTAGPVEEPESENEGAG